VTPYQAHRDARLIELDMITLIEEKYPDNHNFIPLFRKLSDRVGRLADELQKLEQVSSAQIKDAERWRLLFDTPGITSRDNIINNRDHLFQIFRDIANGKKLIGQGKTLTEAADKALGFK
jgi:hypothetical protein